MKNKIIKACALLTLIITSITSCDNTTSEDNNSSNTTSYLDTSVTNTTSGVTTTTSDGGDEVINRDYTDIPPVNVTIRFHNESNSYDNLRYWLWTDTVEIEQEIEKTGVDDFGMYYTFNPDELFGEGVADKGFYFLIKEAGTWNGKTTDTPIMYEDYKPYLVDGVSTLELFAVSGTSGSLDIFDNKKDALGDKMSVNEVIDDFKKLHLVGTNAIKRVRVYRYDSTYYALPENQQNILRTKYKIFDETYTQEENVTEINIPIEDFKFNYTYEVRSSFHSDQFKTKISTVTYQSLYDSEEFSSLVYNGDDLGAVVASDKQSTTFKLWAPTASLVRLSLYKYGNDSSFEDENLTTTQKSEYDYPYINYNMELTNTGVWQYTVDEDLNGVYYTYTVIGSMGNNKVVDPYAKSAGLNGVRGMVVDFESEELKDEEFDKVPQVWDGVEGYDIISSQDLIISENHIRDLTMDETWSSREEDQDLKGTYLGFAKSGTTYTDIESGVTVKTGADHLEELGVNAIQILPFFDQDNYEINSAYNWGYNPLNYNVLEGSYSSNPKDGFARIKEFKQLVTHYANNKNHTRIIMDVVYNHVSKVALSNFSLIVPYYYFRVDDELNYLDGAACGNEFNSQRPMASKFIVDSVTFWASTYKIKGFRFDLMGLLDVNTMIKVKQALYEVDPDIVIYGEPWRADGVWDNTEYALKPQVYSMLWDGYNGTRGQVGGFNDDGRNALKGNNDPGYGFISKGESDMTTDILNQMANMFKGSTNSGANPRQTINYASCHDNFTLFDQLNWTLSPDGGTTKPDEYEVARASVAVNGFILMSNGVAFINGGEELFRSKVEYDDSALESTYKEMYGEKISHNSYSSSDETNAYQYDRKVKFLDYFNMYKDLVNLRKELYMIPYPNNIDSSDDIEVWDNTANTTRLAGYRRGKDNGTYVILLNGRHNGSWFTSNSRHQGSSFSDPNLSLIFNNSSKSPVFHSENGVDYYELQDMYQLVIYKNNN